MPWDRVVACTFLPTRRRFHLASQDPGAWFLRLERRLKPMVLLSQEHHSHMESVLSLVLPTHSTPCLTTITIRKQPGITEECTRHNSSCNPRCFIPRISGSVTSVMSHRLRHTKKPAAMKRPASTVLLQDLTCILAWYHLLHRASLRL